MNTIERLEVEVKKGFTKTQLEKLIGLPMNVLAGIMKGNKKMTAKQELLVVTFLDANPNLNPLDYPKPPKKSKSVPSVPQNKKEQKENSDVVNESETPGLNWRQQLALKRNHKN